MDLFDLARYPVLNKNEKTLLFEAFSGIGTQSMAYDELKEILGIDFEVIGFSDIDKYAIQSYYAIRQDNSIKNYGDISKMDEIPFCHVCTWSFPCQDISLAGKQRGMVEGTRSNYGYDFLETVRRSTNKPKVLIMENVKNLVGEGHKEDFTNIQNILKDMGYENHWKVLNAKHYDVAQNRERVFMISILGGGWFQFPPKIKLTKRLKDYLEDEVDEKYYLNQEQLKWAFGNALNDKLKDVYDRKKAIINKDPAYTVTTKTDRRVGDANFICDSIDDEITVGEFIERNTIKIPEATKQGYSLASDGDGVYINRPHQKWGVVQKEMIQTIKTSGDDVGVVVDGTIFDIKSQKRYQAKPNSEIAPTQYAQEHYAVSHGLRIRKLTPLECWRLMGIKDEYFWRAKNSGVSNTQLYKQAGNAIVVNVLVAIFKNLY